MLRNHCSLHNGALRERRDAYRYASSTTIGTAFQAFFRGRTRKRSGKHRAAARKVARRAPKPRPGQLDDGAFLPDGAAARAGPNRGIPEASWEHFPRILTNKAERAVRLVNPVDARNRARPARCDADRPAA